MSEVDCLCMNRICERLPVFALHALVLGFALLAFYVRQLPPTTTVIPEVDGAESRWWGLWPVTYLPNWIFFGGLALLLLTLAATWYWWIGGRLPIGKQLNGLTTNLSPAKRITILVLCFFVAFFAWPVVHTRWGDAYILTKAIAHPDPALRLTHSWQAPLDLLLHSQLWRIGHEAFGWRDAMPVYHLLSPLAGLLYLSGAIAASRQVAKSSAAPSWLPFALLTSIGVMQLFFGYIENYSFAAAGILIYLWLGLAVLQGERPLWLAAFALAMTNALHPSTIVYGPSLLYLGWQSRQRRNNSSVGIVLQVALPLIAVAAATTLLMELGGHGIGTLLTTDRPGGGDARWLVPLWETSTRWERYTMISWPHLRDILNEQLLVAPMILPTLLLALIGSGFLAHSGRRAVAKRIDQPYLTEIDQKARVKDAVLYFLVNAAFCHQLLIWVWNPDYGGQRDWDLFSLAAIPTTLLVAYLLPRLIPNRRALVAGAIPLLVLQYAQLATWVYQNTLPWEWP